MSNFHCNDDATRTTQRDGAADAREAKQEAHELHTASYEATAQPNERADLRKLSSLDKDEVASLIISVTGQKGQVYAAEFVAAEMTGDGLKGAEPADILELCQTMPQMVAKKVANRLQKFQAEGVPSELLTVSQGPSPSTNAKLKQIWEEKELLLIKGRQYQLEQQLGAGNATVWRATSIGEGGVERVLKMCNKDAAVREKKARDLLGWDQHSRWFLKAFDYQDATSLQDAVIVLEYSAQTLQHRLRNGFFPRTKIPDFAMQLLSGLFELRSKNLVHMDIKPGNIFKVMDARTQDDIWKLGDMDSVCSEGESVHSFTVHYSAPELARAELDGAKAVAKHKMDIWSAGLVVLEVATSEPMLEPALTRDEALHKLCSAEFETELSTSLENLSMAMKTFLQHMLQLEAKKRQEAGQLLCSSFLSGNVTTTIRRAANAEVVSAIEMTAVKVDLIAHQVAANASMLGAILQGEHDCPRWLVVVPKKLSSSSMDWLKPKSWLNTTVVLHFVCPVTMCAVGTGFEMKLPQDWVVKYGPAIRVGVTMLQLAAGAARLAGLPIPSLSEVSSPLMDTMSSQVLFLKDLVDGVAEELNDVGLGVVNDWVNGKLDPFMDGFTELEVDGIPDAKQVVQRSYGEVLALVHNAEPRTQTWQEKVQDTTRCGLVKAICTSEAGKPFEWVRPEWKQQFEEKGRALLLQPNSPKTSANLPVEEEPAATISRPATPTNMDPALPNVFEVETVPEVKPQESRSREGLTKWVYAFKDHKGAWGAYYGSFDEFGRPAGKGRIEYRQGAIHEAAWNKVSGSEFNGEFKNGRMWSGEYRFRDGRTVRMRTGKRQGGQGAADPIPPTHFLVTEKGREKHGFYETYEAIGARDKSIRPLEIVTDGEEAALEMRSDGWARVVKFRQDPKQSQDVTHHIKPALARGEGLVNEGELRTCFELYQKTAMMLLEGSLAPTDRQGLEKMLKKAKSKRSPKDKVAALKGAFELMLRSSIVRNGPYTKIDFGGNPWGWFPIDYEGKAKLYILTSDHAQASTKVCCADKDSRNGAAAASHPAPKVTCNVRAGPCVTAEKIGEKKLSECIVALEYSQFPGWLRFPDDGTLGFHERITCDVSRMSPIVGPRYRHNDLEKNFDVCQEVFESLRPSEQSNYHKVEAKLMPAAGWCICSSPSFKWLPEISSYATFEKKYFLFLRFVHGGCVIAASEPMTERGEPIVIKDMTDNVGWLRLADKTGWTRAGNRNVFGWYLLPEGKGTDFVLAADTEVFAVYKQPGGWTPKNMTNMVQSHTSFQHGAHIVAHVHPDFPDWLYLASGAGWVKRYINSKENPLPGWIEGAMQIPEDVIQKMQENREKMRLLPTEEEDGCLCVVL